jgi:hypothetical protein
MAHAARNRPSDAHVHLRVAIRLSRYACMDDTPSTPIRNAVPPPEATRGSCHVEADLFRGSLSSLWDEDHCRLRGRRPRAMGVVWADRDGTSLRRAGRASRQGLDGALEPRAHTFEHPTPAADPASRRARHGHHRPSGTGNSLRAMEATSYRRERPGVTIAGTRRRIRMRSRRKTTTAGHGRTSLRPEAP